jgi:hypothetical protein
MAEDRQTFYRWLEDARLSTEHLSDEQIDVLEASFEFLEQAGRDYYSLRLLSHFLLHCGLFKKAQVGRLVGVSRKTASMQQKLSSKEVVQAAHHRMRGRPYGKLLPRYAGPIAEFLVQHPKASRDDAIDFIEQAWDVHVSKRSLTLFLKKYGLDRVGDHDKSAAVIEIPSPPIDPSQPVPLPDQEFFFHQPSTPAPSCCYPLPCNG